MPSIGYLFALLSFAAAAFFLWGMASVTAEEGEHPTTTGAANSAALMFVGMIAGLMGVCFLFAAVTHQI